jgi:hypothetical protein
VTFAKATHVPTATPDEIRGAEAMGVSIDVYRLQRRLSRLPLMPHQPWLRKKRDSVLADLYAAARRDRCISRINPFAATERGSNRIVSQSPVQK